MNLNEILPVESGNLVILGALIAGVGKVLHEIPKFPNHFIPITLAVIGGASMAWMEGFTPPAVIMGIVTGLGTVGGHQLITQITDAKDAGKLKEKDVVQPDPEKEGLKKDDKPEPPATPSV